ncbi:hypothetical protein [Streptomyces sp. NPDC054804]
MSARTLGRLAIGLSATAGLLIGTPGTGSAADHVVGGPITMEPCDYDTSHQDQRWWTTGAW